MQFLITGLDGRALLASVAQSIALVQYLVVNMSQLVYIAAFYCGKVRFQCFSVSNKQYSVFLYSNCLNKVPVVQTPHTDFHRIGPLGQFDLVVE